MTFADGLLPPVKAFWSLSMYDGPTQLFIHNPIDRYLAQLDDDGRFPLQRRRVADAAGPERPPEEGLGANWLPAPDGPFYLVLRLYGPEAEALDGTWTPPLAVRIN